MIFDNVTHIDSYRGLGNGIDRAIDFVKATDFSKLDDQQLLIDGDRLYANIEGYITVAKEEKAFEAHRKYIDLQFLISGREIIYCAETVLLEEDNAYSDEKDIVFLKGEAPELALPFEPGSFALLFPQDAHKPCCIRDEAVPVRKCVVKIAIEG